ncbi:hypothetical protein OGM84_07915 [Pediococcus acidilactici]
MVKVFFELNFVKMDDWQHRANSA